jgi:uncharacterized phage protein (TIGR02218 family)
MSRYMHPGLLADLQRSAKTICLLFRFDPVGPEGVSYGVTDTNRDIVYDDNTSSLKYSAAIGAEPSTLASASNMSVDNAEIKSLMPVFDVPISEADIRAGVYDYARLTVYIINYEDLTPGRHCVLHHGTVGQVTIRDDGLSFINEFRGLMAQLKQSLCEKDSLGCRAIFGSQPIGSATPGPQVAFGWCGFDATTLLVDATVADVGIETTLSFQVDDATGWTVDKYAPGIVKFLTGLNAGRSFEIESNTADGWITLQFETGFPIADGDTLQYREDCSKQARDTAKGCKKWFEALWFEHFRGEPDIPVADEGALQTPGAMVGPGGGGNTNVPFEAA